MSNKWKNITSAFVACIMAYLCGVSETDSWHIINSTPSNDVNVIGTMILVLVGSFAICRFFIEMLDCD